MKVLVFIVLCVLIGGCGNPTPLSPDGYRVEPDALSMKVNTAMNFTVAGVSETPSWKSTVGGVSAILAGYIGKPVTTGLILRVTALRPTANGVPLIVCALIGSDWTCAKGVSISP